MLVKLLKKHAFKISQVDRTPHPLLVKSAKLLPKVLASKPNDFIEICSRFIRVNSFSFNDSINDKEQLPKLEILFVTSEKDFRTLSFALEAACKQSVHQITGIKVIVPEKSVSACELSLARITNRYPIEIIAETEFINPEKLLALGKKYTARTGWVVQQILKLAYVSQTQACAVLVVDADTVLLKPRVWINQDLAQVLTPSWEYHLPYFDFLQNLKCFQKSDGFESGMSFVAHHMLMQPKVLTEIFESCGWETIEDLISYLLNLELPKDNSPFSIDYELYGQYLFHKHREKCIIAKWANTSLPFSGNSIPNIEEIEFKFSSFASVSMHSYLD
jgi:hypothetical protein